jgi:hypothetical protein
VKVAELFDPNFKLLDASPSKPLDAKTVMAAMKQLHARVERQADLYGGKIDPKTGKIDKSKHRFVPAQIAHP